MVIAANFEKKYETLISIDLEEDIRKDNLKIIINTYGYLLDGYEPSKHIGRFSNQENVGLNAGICLTKMIKSFLLKKLLYLTVSTDIFH